MAHSRSTKLKNKNINIRVTEDQHTAIMQQARKLGMTVSAYILMLAGAK
jgi:predicted DNA binding CopG/RHH family protein